MYRHRLLALMVAVVALVSIPKGINADVVFNQQIPYAAVVANPCQPGNPLSLNGTIHVLLHLTTNANGHHYDLSVNTDNVEAIDTVTGTVYSSQESGNFCPGCRPDSLFAKFNGSFTGPQMEIGGVLAIGLESHASEPNVLITQTVHFTINANGGLTANVPFENNLSCQGT